ncbi:hypothetical protein Hanom_Chr01g00006631 [Helianthus anomalus]
MLKGWCAPCHVGRKIGTIPLHLGFEISKVCSLISVFNPTEVLWLLPKCKLQF